MWALVWVLHACERHGPERARLPSGPRRSACRGMADFEQGLPDARPAFRVVMGGPEGLMVGTYPVSPDRAYYFVCRPVPEARPPSRALLQ